MTNLQKLSVFAALVQAGLWILLVIIFFVILPQQGFLVMQDFNNPAKVASAPWAMVFIVWSDVLFGLSMLVCVYVFYFYLRRRISLLAARAITIVLFGAVGWFLAHDMGIHVIGWSGIARDPAATNYAMDRILWAYRNGVFLAVSLLMVMATARPASSKRPLMNSGNV